MKNIDAALQPTIKNILSSTNVGDRVYAGHIPTGSWPAVSFYHISAMDLPGWELSEPNGISKILVQVSIYTDTKAEAHTISDVVMDYFNGFRGNIGSGQYQINMFQSMINGRQFMMDESTKKWHTTIDLYLVYEES